MTAAEARLVAQRAVLASEDLGSAWHVAPSASRKDSALDLTGCGKVLDIEKQAIARGPQFTFVTAPDGASLDTFALVTGKTLVVKRAAADGMFARLRDPAFKACAAELSNRGGVEGGTFDVQSTQLQEVALPPADQVVQLVLPFTTTVKGSTTTPEGTADTSHAVRGSFTVDFIRRGQAVTVLLLMNIEDLVEADALEGWATSIAERQAQPLDGE